jgi:hypothetical protein
MNLLSKQEIEQLVSDHEGPCTSIYMPAVRAGSETQQNPIRFKNLLRKAKTDLEAQGYRTNQIEKWLEPAWDLLNNEVFWQNQSNGLAAFIAQDFFQNYRLPLNFREQALVAGHFMVKPLLELFSNNGHFYILALSQDHVRLLEGTRYSVDEVEVDEIPTSLAEALNWDDPEEHLQYHSGEGASTGGREPSVTYHGHGVGKNDTLEKKDILRYFQKIDKGLQEVLAEESSPMLLAGVKYLFPIYQEANQYNYLMDQGIPGNPDELSPQELHKAAWQIVAPRFSEQQEQAADRYRQLAGMEPERTSNNLNEIIPAAYKGQVEAVFLTPGIHQWGQYDWSSTQVKLEEEPSAENRDLVDLAAAQTLLNGGRVYVVDPDNLPDAAPFAAILRF